MRIVRRVALWGCLVVFGLADLTYLADDLWARYRGRPVEQIKIDRVYNDVNQWNQLEHAIGTPVMETCVDAMLPHFGYTPCWYLKRHTMRQIGP